MANLARAQAAVRPAGTLPLTVVAVASLSGQSMAVLNPADLDGITCPTVALLGRDGEQVRVWVYLEGQVNDPDGNPITVPAGSVGLTTATRNRSSARAGDQVTLRFAQRADAVVRAAQVDDIPSGASVYLAPDAADALAGGSAGWALATSNRGVAAPVRLLPRDGLNGVVRVSMAMRILLDAPGGQDLHLSGILPYTPAERRRLLWRRVWRHRHTQRQGGRWVTLAGFAILLVRRADLLLEQVLRVLLGAPSLALRTTQAHPGDDTFDGIRINATAFASLGIAPGDHVLVSWGLAQKALVALEDHLPHGSVVPGVVTSGQMVDKVSAAVADAFPAHMVARVPASVRMELGMPPSSVVEVRRRLRPVVGKHLNTLTLPVAGLILAGVAVPGVRGWPLVVGSAVPMLFGIAALRKSGSPRGPWP